MSLQRVKVNDGVGQLRCLHLSRTSPTSLSRTSPTSLGSRYAQGRKEREKRGGGKTRQSVPTVPYVTFNLPYTHPFYIPRSELVMLREFSFRHG